MIDCGIRTKEEERLQRKVDLVGTRAEVACGEHPQALGDWLRLSAAEVEALHEDGDRR